MIGKRYWHTLALYAIFNSKKRAEYLRKHHVFKSMGENCNYQGRLVPLYPNLIKIGDNVLLSSNVRLVTHNAVHQVLNNMKNTPPSESRLFSENIGCIEIGNNCFIGVNSIINSNVRIGDNVIVSAGSLVLNDIPSNSVVRGVPAKRICSVDQLYDIMKEKPSYPRELAPKMGTSVGKELEDWLWNHFEKARRK